MTIEFGGWELEHSDAGQPPGAKGGLLVNTMRVWARQGDDPWVCTGHRSMYAAKRHIEKHGTPELVSE